MKWMLLHKEIIISLSRENTIARLDKKKPEFEIKKTGDGSYKFLSEFSVGTAINWNSSRKIEGIKVFGKIISSEDHSTRIEIFTRLRVELIAVLVFWLLTIHIQLFGDEKVPFFVTLIIFPLIFSCFWFILRIQEKRLFQEVESLLKKL